MNLIFIFLFADLPRISEQHQLDYDMIHLTTELQL